MTALQADLPEDPEARAAEITRCLIAHAGDAKPLPERLARLKAAAVVRHLALAERYGADYNGPIEP